LVKRATRFWQRLSTTGRIALVAGAAIACGALLTLAASLAGEESGGSGHASPSTAEAAAQSALRGGCTLAREDGTLEQITLTGRPVSGSLCHAFAAYLEENVGVEEHTWSPRAPARPLTRANCSSCTVQPACRVSVATPSAPHEPILFIAEVEEASDELHYDSVYTHDICTLLDGRVEIERFIEHFRSS
jgi:hypothetical protein